MPFVCHRILRVGGNCHPADGIDVIHAVLPWLDALQRDHYYRLCTRPQSQGVFAAWVKQN
jgi:hypothetical protein